MSPKTPVVCMFFMCVCVCVGVWIDITEGGEEEGTNFPCACVFILMIIIMHMYVVNTTHMHHPPPPQSMVCAFHMYRCMHYVCVLVCVKKSGLPRT